MSVSVEQSAEQGTRKPRRNRRKTLREMAMPLSRFPEEHRQRILDAVAQPEPPEKYIYFGVPGDPRPLAWMESRAWFEWHWQRGMYPGEERPALPARLRAAVIERDGYVCQLCREDVDPTELHIDHIHPWSKGGRHKLDNLQVTHAACNIRKGARV